MVPGPSITFSMSNTLFDSNFADDGGAFFLNNYFDLHDATSSAASITNCTFKNNFATQLSGYPLIIVTTHKIQNPKDSGKCEIERNEVTVLANLFYHFFIVYIFRYGGALYLHDFRYNISGCTFSNNLASNRGGAIYSTQSTVYINDCVVTNNFANISGSGIDCSSSNITFFEPSVYLNQNNQDLVCTSCILSGVTSN